MLIEWLRMLFTLPCLALAIAGDVDCKHFEGAMRNWAVEAFMVQARDEAVALRYDAGLAWVEQAMVFQADDARLYTLRGELTLLLYAWDDALADFNRAVALDADYAPAYYHRGILYYTMTQREHALADFEIYLLLAPDGQWWALASSYVESLRIELEALGGG